MKKATYEELEQMHEKTYQRNVDSNVKIGELLEENKQLKTKLDFFKSVAKQKHEKAQTGEQTLERILYAHSDWAHKIAKEGLEEMKK